MNNEGTLKRKLAVRKTTGNHTEHFAFMNFHVQFGHIEKQNLPSITRHIVIITILKSLMLFFIKVFN